MPTPAAPHGDSTGRPSAPLSPAQGPVVFALTPAERALFFPELDDAQLPADARWLEERELSADHWETTLRRHAPAVLVTGWRTPSLPQSWIDDPACPLRYVCHVTGSVRQLVPRSFVARGGLVTNWGPLASPQVAEHALLLALSALRNQGRWRDYILRSPTERRLAHLATRTLYGRRVGVHGFGGVARALLLLLRPFNTRLAIFADNVPPTLIANAGATACTSLGELFAHSDVLFECEALTPATVGVVSAEILARLPNGAVFINVGRGHLVDEPALACEARTGRIRVALDVVHEEPVTPATALTEISDAIISPHIGGPTLDRYPDCGTLALRNLRRFLTGDPLDAVITPEIFDRST